MTILEAESIRRSLVAGTLSQLDRLVVFAEIDSTNRYLLDQPKPAPGRLQVALAEHQTAGRGRRGKVWRAPPSRSICLSIAYSFREGSRILPSLSLAVGVAVLEALQELGVPGAALKWPNDIMVGDAKLGGILVETRAATIGSPTSVVGLGLNVDLSGYADADVAPDRTGAITDLRRCADALPSRSDMVALLIDRIYAALMRFDAQGFSAFVDRWNRCDWLRGRQTTVDTATGPVTGAAEGVDHDGALMLMTRQGRRIVSSGSVVLPMSTSAA